MPIAVASSKIGPAHSELVSQNGAYFRLVRDQLELEGGSS